MIRQSLLNCQLTFPRVGHVAPFRSAFQHSTHILYINSCTTFFLLESKPNSAISCYLRHVMVQRLGRICLWRPSRQASIVNIRIGKVGDAITVAVLVAPGVSVTAAVAVRHDGAEAGLGVADVVLDDKPASRHQTAVGTNIQVVPQSAVVTDLVGELVVDAGLGQLHDVQVGVLARVAAGVIKVLQAPRGASPVSHAVQFCGGSKW